MIFIEKTDRNTDAIEAFRNYGRKRAGMQYELTEQEEECVEIALSGISDAAEDAVFFVYMKQYKEKSMKRISNRVRLFSNENHYSERSVWRMLKKARNAYAVAKGGYEI